MRTHFNANGRGWMQPVSTPLLGKVTPVATSDPRRGLPGHAEFRVCGRWILLRKGGFLRSHGADGRLRARPGTGTCPGGVPS